MPAALMGMTSLPVLHHQPRKNEFRGMLQTMLAQRFLLVTHWGEKPYPEYTLRIDKGGLKVKPVQDQGGAPAGKDGVAASEVKPKFSMNVVKGYMHLEFVRKPILNACGRAGHTRYGAGVGRDRDGGDL